MHENEAQYEIALSAKELRYLVSCGAALLQRIPDKSLATYTNLTKQEIIDFCGKVRPAGRVAAPLTVWLG